MVRFCVFIVNCRVRYPLRGFVRANALEIACCAVWFTEELSEQYGDIAHINSSNVYKWAVH